MQARYALAAALALGGWALSGCVAAAIPLAASATIGSKVSHGRARAAAAGPPQSMPVAPTGAVPGQGAAPANEAMQARGPVGDARPAPSGMQYLYGSGEAAALSIQAYQALWNYIRVEIGMRRDKAKARSVILSPGSTLADPRFDLCGKRPLAVVFDIDETVLLNLGFEADQALRDGAFSESRWSRWEATGAGHVDSVPGALETIDAIRREGITVILNSNRLTANAQGTIAALQGAGLGTFSLGDTLWLRGAGEPGGKDARRWRIAERYCVVAMAGDQLGDFSDLFDVPGTAIGVRRNAATGSMVTQLWGAGWFLLPNPVYGAAMKGSVGDVFPAARRWTDPGPPPPAAASPVPKE